MLDDTIRWHQPTSLNLSKGQHMKRHAMSRAGSKRQFTANAVGHHKRNFTSNPMRGGIRL